MSSNSLELLDEGRVFELVHHPARLDRRPQSCSSANSSTQEGQKSSSKRAVSAVSRSLEVLPPETPSSPPQVPCHWNLPPPTLPPPNALSNSSKDEEIGSPLEDVEGGQVDMLNTLSPAPDEEQDGREGNEVEAEGRGSPEVDRLVAEIQEMHLMVQALLKGSRGTQEGEGEEEEDEGREHKHQDTDRTLSHAYPSTVLQERSSTTPGLKDSASQSNASTSTPQGQVDAAQELGEGKQREEWAWLFGEEGEMADKLRKAIAKMKKLDDKLTSVTKRERELKLQRKHLEQQLAMLEAGPMGGPPLELEYMGEGLREGQETDSDGSPSPPIPPVFATEIHPLSVPLPHTQLGGSGGVMGEGAGEVLEGRPRQPWSDAAGEEKRSDEHDPEVQEGRRKKWRRKGEQPRQDFIRRNIELASDAGSSVAMTEEEKKRLESLLLDSDEEGVEKEGKEKTHHKQAPDSRTALVAHTGFGLDVESTQRLRDIESRLSVYGGSEADRVGHTASMLDSTLYQSGHCEATERGSVYGETALGHDTAGRGGVVMERVRSERDDQLRMREIDARLHLLQQYKENEGEMVEEESSTRLAAEQLQALLAQCQNELATSQSGTLILDNDAS